VVDATGRGGSEPVKGALRDPCRMPAVRVPCRMPNGSVRLNAVRDPCRVTAGTDTML
jgi:hypothetical protein